MPSFGLSVLITALKDSCSECISGKTLYTSKMNSLFHVIAVELGIEA